jgi:hypothetical protein
VTSLHKRNRLRNRYCHDRIIRRHRVWWYHTFQTVRCWSEGVREMFHNRNFAYTPRTQKKQNRASHEQNEQRLSYSQHKVYSNYAAGLSSSPPNTILERQSAASLLRPHLYFNSTTNSCKASAHRSSLELFGIDSAFSITDQRL